jgi:CheY-like chemotaxis protein
MTMPARILIIEDNTANLELVRYLLESAGHAILSATNGMDGIAMARRELPDLVLCDLQLPLLDGYGVLQQLRESEECKDVAVVAVTAFSMRGDEHRVLTAGFDGYLAKPIDPERFIGQIEAFLLPQPEAEVRRMDPGLDGSAHG